MCFEIVKQYLRAVLRAQAVGNGTITSSFKEPAWFLPLFEKQHHWTKIESYDCRKQSITERIGCLISDKTVRNGISRNKGDRKLALS